MDKDGAVSVLGDGSLADFRDNLLVVGELVSDGVVVSVVWDVLQRTKTS